MRNGNYILIKAPEEWESKKYRNKYIYEHHYVYWKNTGIYLNDDEIIHHVDGNYINNNFNNLQLMKCKKHTSFHRKEIEKNKDKYLKMVTLKCPVCDKIFDKPRYATHLEKNQTITCCSRKCSGASSSYTRRNKPLNIKDNVINEYILHYKGNRDEI